MRDVFEIFLVGDLWIFVHKADWLEALESKNDSGLSKVFKILVSRCWDGFIGCEYDDVTAQQDDGPSSEFKIGEFLAGDERVKFSPSKSLCFVA